MSAKSGLSKLLSRGSSGFPSVVTLIDKENMKPEERHSHRKTLIALSEFSESFRKNGKDGSMLEFSNLMDCYFAPDERDIENIHPSELLDACPRALYYRITDVEPTNKVSRGVGAKTMRTFHVGSWYHWYIQNLLYRSGILKKHEVEFHNKELRLIGKADGLIILVGEDLILEIKTINSYGYGGVVKRGKPLDHHIYQASIYAKELKVSKILFLYINKDTSDMFEVILLEKDFKDYQEDAYEKVNIVHDAVDKGTPPKRPCMSPMDDMAVKCAYCNHCFKL